MDEDSSMNRGGIQNSDSRRIKIVKVKNKE
jgi:hypothetical protein